MRARLSIIIAIVALMTFVPDAWGATFTTFIDPWDGTGTINLKYLQTYTIRHDGEGSLAQKLDGQEWRLTQQWDESESAVAGLRDIINAAIRERISGVEVTDLDVAYSANMVSREKSTDIDYKIEIDGNLNGVVFRNEDATGPGILDMGWRYFAVSEPIVLDGIDINTPLSAIESNSPEVYEAIRGTDAGELLSEPLMISGDFTDPLDIWHFLFDPTGISVDASQFGLSDELAGKVVSRYTLGESSIREGRKTDEVLSVPFTLEREYSIRTVKTINIAELAVIGHTSISALQDIEALEFSTDPIGTTTSTGQFPIFIVYGMAGMAGIGAIVFFFISSRQLKKEKGATQTGIDPALLRASATSSAAGGYQTNRGESQLRSDYDSVASSSPEISDESTRGSMPKGWKKD